MLVKSHPLLVGPQIDAVTIEISVENFPEDKVNLQKDPLIPTPWHLPTQDFISYCRPTCSPLFITAIFTMAKKQKQPSCPSTNGRIMKMQNTHTMEFDSVINKNGTMRFSGKWIRPQNILSKVTQTQKCYMAPLFCGSQICIFR